MSKKVDKKTDDTDLTDDISSKDVGYEPSKKVKTLPIEEREGHAIVSVDVPAHKAEVSVGHSTVPGVIAATVEAWHKVKGHDDAEFAKCTREHRQDLINHAEEIHRTGVVMEGDTVMARFEQEVAKIYRREEEKAAKKAA
jgi:hypothetical protein